MSSIGTLTKLIEDENYRKKLTMCYQCGMCTGGCPVAHVNSEYNPRRIVESVILGQHAEILRSELIWLCTSCHSCLERCPQRIEVSELLVELRNLAAKTDNVPRPLLERAKRIAETGQSTPTSKASMTWREKLHLPPMAPVNIEEIQAILQHADFPCWVDRARSQTYGARK